MSSPRDELAAALRAVVDPSVAVFAQEPSTAPALPALVIRPGVPYRRPTRAPCVDAWRVQVVACVPLDAVDPLDALDELADEVRTATDGPGSLSWASWLGVAEGAVERSIAGKPMRASVVELELREV